MIFDVQDIYLWVLCLMRCGALMFWIPFFTGKTVPTKVRAGLASLVSLFVFNYVDSMAVDVPYVFGELILYMLKELMVGSLMGIAIRIVFAAVEFTGHVMSQEVGLAMSSSFDPTSGSQSTTIGSLLFYFTVLLLLATETHHEVLYVLMRSYEVMPIGLVKPGPGGMQNMIEDTSWIFVLGLQMAAPIVAVAFVVNLTFAVLGKAAPKFNVFVTSFALRILVGLFFVAMTIGLVTQYILYGLGRSSNQMLQYLIP